MKTVHCGIILNTQNYEACIAFYGETLGHPQAPEITPDDPEITCFNLGDTYLMAEAGGCAHRGSKPIEHCPTKFRFNVKDVEGATHTLRERGVDVDVLHYSWGTTAKFCNPDGNRCALRSERGYGN